MSAIIIDTETTGLHDPDVIELAHTGPLMTPLSDTVEFELYRFKPRKPITVGAMATHHILEHELEHSTPWPGMWNPLVEVSGSLEYLIGHGIDYDVECIGMRESKLKRICTLALSRALYPDNDSHKLGAMIYTIYPPKMARELVRGAHSAMTDVNLCLHLLQTFVMALQVQDWHALWLLSEAARVPKRFTFGKYGQWGECAEVPGERGALISEVRKHDQGYIKWCLKSCATVRDDPYYVKALTQ